MPRPIRFKTAAVGELLKQLRFASPDVRLRQMRAAERLAREIDPALTYPDEFIMFRVTGYRPDSADTGAILFGAALVGDLAQLVTELSKELSIEADGDRAALPVEALAAKWGVSLKSLSRYRHRGLICHMLVIDGRHQMACYVDEAVRFAAAHPDLLRRASDFRRMDKATVAAVVERARALRGAGAPTLNKVARVLAKEHSRSLEAVRGVLQRHDAEAETPIFTDPGPLSERQRRVMYRAWRMGVPPRELGRRFGKSIQTVHRAVNAQRLAMLGSVPMAFVNMPTFERLEAEDVILSPRSVRTGLNEDERFHDAFTLIAACKSMSANDVDVEQQRLAAYNWLKRRAHEAMQTADAWPTAETVDDIEASLRWASRLKRRLVESSLPAAIRAIEQALHRPLTQQPSPQVLALIQVAVLTASTAVETFDPWRGSGLDRVVGFAMGRAMATLAVPDRPGRAAARHAGEALPTAELFDALNPWQAWLDLPWRLRASVGTLAEDAQHVVELVIGLTDEAPLTPAQAARKLGMTKSRAARVLHRAVIELRRAAP
jgi:RNA polymerase primary sigma factor